MAMVNNANETQSIECNAACFAAMGAIAPKFTVKDLWTKQVEIVEADPQFGFIYRASVSPMGGSRIFKVSVA